MRKKMMSMVLAVVMVLSVMVPAMAAGGNGSGGGKGNGGGKGQGQAAITLVSTIPADGAEDVAADQVITLQFSNNVTWSNKGSEDMILTNAKLITLKDAEGNAVAAEVTAPEKDEKDPGSEEYQKIFVKPEALRGNTTYTVEIAAGILANNGKTTKDAYTVTFTTKAGAGQGKMEPTLVSTIPADGAKDVAADQVITLQFSNNVTWSNKDKEDMIVTNAKLVTLKDAEGNAVAAEVTAPEKDEKDPASKEYQKLFVEPAEALTAGTYTVEIAAGILANNGQVSKDAYTVTFTVAEAPVAWDTEAMAFAQENGLLEGAPAIQPEDAVTRGLLVQMLYNLEDKPASDAANTFGDVAEDAWYFDAVTWAADEGIVNGNGVGYAPEDAVTREQLATILWRYSDKPQAAEQASFADRDTVSGYAVDAVDWAAESGILNGMDQNLVAPKGQATCAQIAAMLMRMVSIAK